MNVQYLIHKLEDCDKSKAVGFFDGEKFIVSKRFVSIKDAESKEILGYALDATEIAGNTIIKIEKE